MTATNQTVAVWEPAGPYQPVERSEVIRDRASSSQSDAPDAKKLRSHSVDSPDKKWLCPQCGVGNGQAQCADCGLSRPMLAVGVSVTPVVTTEIVSKDKTERGRIEGPEPKRQRSTSAPPRAGKQTNYRSKRAGKRRYTKLQSASATSSERERMTRTLAVGRCVCGSYWSQRLQQDIWSTRGVEPR